MQSSYTPSSPPIVERLGNAGRDARSNVLEVLAENLTDEERVAF